MKTRASSSLSSSASTGSTGSTEPSPPEHWTAWFHRSQAGIIAGLALAGIAVHLILRFAFQSSPAVREFPLLVVLAAGGAPLVLELLRKVWRRDFGSDLLAGISIITSVLLGEYLAGSIVVLMLSGGGALETYALGSASSVLRALAERMPSTAHRKKDSVLSDIAVAEIAVGDDLVIFPHEVCPVDGTVTDGNGFMNEAFLTGEPYDIAKAPGSAVISGAVNGKTALTIRAGRVATDSRYAKIMEVMRESQTNQPRLKRLGDQLGAVYTPVAVGIALLAWILSGDPVRFLSVLVIATPCPLLIAIPVAVIGSISLAARRSIIIRNPAALEQLGGCRTAIFDKTGTLTYGEPSLTEQVMAPGFEAAEVLALAASVEVYSKHPLASAILKAAKADGLKLQPASSIEEPPGQGLTGVVSGRRIIITSRAKLARLDVTGTQDLPSVPEGLECLVVIDGKFAAAYCLRDAPRKEGEPFIRHLGPSHRMDRIMILSGDRESEVRHLAGQLGITEIHAGKSPEQKLAVVREETARAGTLYVGDGINDAPAMMAATVGIAVGQNSGITAEAADAVIMDGNLGKLDELLHISQRMRAIALQSAVGGMALSLVGMVVAATGHLGPVAGAVSQEIIDIAAVLNALRAAFPPRIMSDVG